MESGFKILGHACMKIEYGNTSLLIDPWLIGSCYWRSWWNYPPNSNENVQDALTSQHIYISHIHWDHWHGPTLKKFDRNTHIITHNEPNTRSVDDLRKIGFKNITILNNGETFTLDGQMKVTPYQFGLFLNDSAVVVETPNFKILDVNDCKIAGGPLNLIKKKHGQFDFALRSHSSANDRVCYHIANETNAVLDDNDHYARSFKYFMDVLAPRFAVPFASNHCHLHQDVFSFNSYINNPVQLEQKLLAMGGLEVSEFKLMLPGDSWSPHTGFNIDSRTTDWFVDGDKHLEEYRSEKDATLQAYYDKENRVKISNAIFDRFFNDLATLPWYVRRKFKDFSFNLELRRPDGNNEFYHLKPFQKIKAGIEKASFRENIALSMPALVFRDAVIQKMFHHSGISKRNVYYCRDRSDFYMLTAFMKTLENVELGLYPLKMKYIGRTINAYVGRWRELLVFFKAAYLVFVHKKKPYEVEELILQDSKYKEKNKYYKAVND